MRKKKPVAAAAEVIVDADHELVLARVCGIEVGKASASASGRGAPRSSSPKSVSI